MESLLETWGLGDLVPVFLDQKITLENVIFLSDELIRELIPTIGTRMLFTEKLKEYRKTSIINMPLVLDASKKDDTSSGAEENLTAGNDIYQELFIIDAQNCTSDTPPQLIPSVNRSISFHGPQDISSSLGDSLPDFDLNTLLSVSPYGSKILEHYKHKGVLSDLLRNKLVDIIIRHLFGYILKHRLTHIEYNKVTAKIITLFPNECSAIYYVPSIAKNDSYYGRPIVARGKLVDKCRNVLYNSPDKTYIRKRKSTVLENENSNNKAQKLTEDDIGNATWLKHNREPWSEVVHRWEKTFEIRKNNKEKTVALFLAEWPVLTDPRADCLVEIDFKKLYPDSALKLLQNWDTFAKEVINFKRNTLVNEHQRDSQVNEYLSYLSEENIENISEDSKVALQLLTIAYLLPPKGRQKLGKSHWKYSTLECVDSLIVQAKCSGDIDRMVSEKIEKAANRKIPYAVQPYLLVEGPSFKQVRTSYVVIDRVRYQLDSTLKALDIVFKLFHTLNAHYPPQAKHIWQLIERGLFKVSSCNEALCQEIKDLLNALP